jgi:hypothetical protein
MQPAHRPPHILQAQTLVRLSVLDSVRLTFLAAVGRLTWKGLCRLQRTPGAGVRHAESNASTCHENARATANVFEQPRLPGHAGPPRQQSVVYHRSYPKTDQTMFFDGTCLQAVNDPGMAPGVANESVKPLCRHQLWLMVKGRHGCAGYRSDVAGLHWSALASNVDQARREALCRWS